MEKMNRKGLRCPHREYFWKNNGKAREGITNFDILYSKAKKGQEPGKQRVTNAKSF